MRRLRFIPVMLAVLLASCSKSVMFEGTKADVGEGTLELTLGTEQRKEQAKASAAGVPDVNDFRVAIYKTENQMRLYNDSYANTIGKQIKLNAGEYRLVAQWGDSLGCGFDKPYYLADPTFTIKQGPNTLATTAKIANVKLAVTYDESFTNSITDYYAVVKHNTLAETEVKFVKEEKRNGYIPAGELYIEVYAHMGEKWKYYKSAPATYKPNDFVTFNITTENLEGNLVIEITTDSSVESKNETVTIPQTALPQAAPTITMAGFSDEGNAHNFVEGMNPAEHNAMASFIAKGGIAQCILDIRSSYLTEKGLKSQYDFANLTSEDKLKLRNAGFKWDENLKDSRQLSFLDFSAVVQDMVSNVKAQKVDNTVAEFTLKVVDGVKKETTANFKVVSLGVTVSLELAQTSVWAKRIESPKVTFTHAVPSLISFETSTDGVRWDKCSNVGLTAGNTIDFGSVTGLTPGTKYYARAVYNNSNSITSDIVIVNTEAAAQVGNSGFEDWNTQRFSYDITWGGTFDYDWFLPWGNGENDPWWAVTSKASMKAGGNGAVSNYHVKSCHTAAPSTDAHGGKKSAHIYSVNVGNMNTDAAILAGNKTFAGELFIGKAADNGTHASDGHSFGSRPDKIRFWYKYKPCTGTTEKFYAVVELKAEDGTSLFRKEITDGPEQTEWTQYEIPVEYTDRTKKVGTLIIGFKSCSGTPEVKSNSQLEINGITDFTAHLGSSLRIDDIELVYE